MADHGGIVVVNGGGGIVQGGQKVLPDVADLRGVSAETAQHKADVFRGELHESSLDHLCRKIVARYPHGLARGTDGLHQDLQDFLQLLLLVGIFPTKQVVGDVLGDDLTIAPHLCGSHFGSIRLLADGKGIGI